MATIDTDRHERQRIETAQQKADKFVRAARALLEAAEELHNFHRVENLKGFLDNATVTETAEDGTQTTRAAEDSDYLYSRRRSRTVGQYKSVFDAAQCYLVEAQAMPQERLDGQNWENITTAEISVNIDVWR